jgi:hypothetical protein
MIFFIFPDAKIASAKIEDKDFNLFNLQNMLD